MWLFFCFDTFEYLSNKNKKACLKKNNNYIKCQAFGFQEVTFILKKILSLLRQSFITGGRQNIFICKSEF